MHVKRALFVYIRFPVLPNVEILLFDKHCIKWNMLSSATYL